MNCDVLAGERGPSCTRLEQLPKLKLVHIRFIRKDMHNNAFATDSMTTSNISDAARTFSILLHPKRKVTELSVFPNLKKKKEQAHTVQPCPRSLSFTAMMKLGTAISTAAAPPVSIEV